MKTEDIQTIENKAVRLPWKKYRWGNHPVLIFASILILVPLFYVFNTALKSEAEFTGDILGVVKKVTLENFIDAFQKANMGVYAFSSILFTFVISTMTVFLCAMASYPISRQLIRGSKFLYTLFM